MTTSRKFLWLFPLALAFTAGGCATHVAVDSPASNVAVNNWGTLNGIVNGDITTVFHATNNALDGLHYFRVGQEVSKSEIDVIARGIKDVKVTVEITPGKDEGTSKVAISVGDGNLPDSQKIFAAINQQLGHASSGGSSGLSTPSRE